MDTHNQTFLHENNKGKLHAMYTDYEGIVPHEKLSDFLFDYLHKYQGADSIKNTEEELMSRSLQSHIAQYSKHRLLIGFLDRVFLKLYSKRNPFVNSQQHKIRILFRLFKYSDIILGAKKYQKVGLVTHAKDRLFAIKHGMGYVITSDLDQYVLAYLQEKNITYLYQLIQKIEDKLKITKPDYIVLWNDIFPIERAMVLASKKLGITTLEIQHGVYDPSRSLETGKVVDYVLVWGQYFKDLYVKQDKRKKEAIYILGYPYSMKKNQRIKNPASRYVVCYLGQDLEIYDKDFLLIKLETANRMYAICKKLNLEFIYRPHPGDDRNLLEEKLPYICFTPMREKIEETFKKADIFISFQSTALVEAAIRSKVALQLMNYPLISDNFEALGACKKSLKTLEELEDYLKKIDSAGSLDEFKIKFNNDYVETRYEATQRFLEIIEEIEKRKKIII